MSAAKAFMAKGANIIVVGRNADSVAEAKKLLGKNAEALAADAIHPETAINAMIPASKNLEALMVCIM